jgi:hypothetical protein
VTSAVKWRPGAALLAFVPRTVRRGCGIGWRASATGKARAAEGCSAAAVVLCVGSDSVTAHSLSVAGVAVRFLDAPVIAGLAWKAFVGAPAERCRSGGLATRPSAQFPGCLLAVLAFAHGVSSAAASAA